jgi:DNA-directed RNA polymerase subunit RPC12/RpoP
MKYWLKRCPKCSGDLREEADPLGSYIACMQCGYTLTYTQEAALMTSGTLPQPMVREEQPQEAGLQPARHRRSV